MNIWKHKSLDLKQGGKTYQEEQMYLKQRGGYRNNLKYKK